tara:strand:- start:2543 stop:3214 length:672 start_codon:yes stop_codon:yes gene_type:complete
MTAWSYSSISTFKQCPKKYYHLKVAKDVKDKGSEAMLYGNLVHKAAEDYIKNGKEVPAKFNYIVPTLVALDNIPGEKHCELKLGVTFDGENYTPTTFFGKDVWWRGVADLLIVDGEKGFLVDYKTGKNTKYADTAQLDLLAAAIFTHFPQLKVIKSALAYLVSNDFIKKEHKVELRNSYFSTFNEQLERLEAAEEHNVWNAISGPLCGWCPVTKCEHWKERKK